LGSAAFRTKHFQKSIHILGALNMLI